MKLHDALRNDAELRRDVEALLDRQRQVVLADLEAAPADDLSLLRTCKVKLDVLRDFKFQVMKGLP